MIMEQSGAERWPGRKSEPRAGCYQYKNVRFTLVRCSRSSEDWKFQPFGREARNFATWDEAVTAVEETCTALAEYRAARRNK
jgi:hypothetical protein